MLKKILLLFLFVLVFVLSFYSNLLNFTLNFESAKLMKFLKSNKISDYIVVKADNVQANTLISSLKSDKNIIFDCFTDFDEINFSKNNKYYSSIVFLNSNTINSEYKKNNYSYVFNKKNKTSYTNTIPQNLKNINASGFFEFNKVASKYSFKLLDKVNNKIIFSLPLAYYLSKTSFKKIKINNDNIKIVKETTGTDIYINFEHSYKYNLNVPVNSIKEVEYSNKVDLNKYKNIIISKCNDYDKDRSKLLAVAINNLRNKIIVPSSYNALSLLIILIFLLFCFCINFINLKVYKNLLFVILLFAYLLFSFFVYKYADIHIPILFALFFGVLSFLVSCYFFKKNEAGVSYDGEAIVMYSSFNKIDFNNDVFDIDVLNIINDFWKEYEFFVVKTKGVNIFTTSKSRLSFWPENLINKIDFEKEIAKLREKYLKVLLVIDKEFVEKFKPQILIDYGRIYFDSKLKSSFGDIIRKVHKLAKINRKYSSFVLMSEEASMRINKNNLFYPIDIKLFALDWIVKFDIKEYLVLFNNFTQSFDEEDIKLFAKLIENDENSSFKLLYEKLCTLKNFKLEE